MKNSKQLRRPLARALYFCLTVMLIACNQDKDRVIDQSISIYLFKSRNPALPSPPIQLLVADSWKPLLAVDLTQSDLVIREDDLASYDWAQQTFTLTSDLKERFEEQDYAFINDYFVLTLGDTPVVAGIILHPFSAQFSRVPTLENYDAITTSEDTPIKMTLQTGNLPGTIPLFPGDDAKLTEKVRLRLLEIGKLINPPTPQAGTNLSAELTIIAQLVRIDTTVKIKILELNKI